LQFYRELKSHQAVFKHIGDNKCIFMHMYVCPEDAKELLEETTIAQLVEVKDHVCLLVSQQLLTGRSPDAKNGSRWRRTPN